MLRRDLGFLVSRVMAVVCGYWLIYMFGQDVRGDLILYANKYAMPAGLAPIWDFAVQIVCLLALGWLCVNLWFQADKFGGSIVVSSSKTVGVTGELRSVAIFSVGLYLLAVSIPSFFEAMAQFRTEYLRYALVHEQPALTNFIEPVTTLVIGGLLLMISTKPKWLTLLFASVKSSYSYDDEPETTEPPQPDLR